MASARFSLLALAVVGLSTVLILAARSGRDDSFDRVRQAGVVRVGYAVEAPYAFLTENGEVTGQSPELARLVVAALGIPKVEWRLAEFAVLLDELESQSVDVVAAGMFITAERAARVAFSEPIFHVRQGLLVAAGNPLGLHDYDVLTGATGARVAALDGSIEQTLLLRLGVAPERLVCVPDARTGLKAVEGGLADALALSSVSLAWMTRNAQLGRTETARPFTQPNRRLLGLTGYGAFVFRKRDKALLDAWNAAQAPLVAGPDYLNLLERFGFDRQELPGPTTTREILTR